jgi:hypothetical protein
MSVRFKTGFVVGCAAGYYLTERLRRLKAPLAGRTLVTAPSSGWPLRNGAGGLSTEITPEKLRAITDLARERATDLLQGPLGSQARDRAMALFEETLTAVKSGSAAKR